MILSFTHDTIVSHTHMTLSFSHLFCLFEVKSNQTQQTHNSSLLLLILPRTFRVLERLCFVFCSTYFVRSTCFHVSVEQNQTKHKTTQHNTKTPLILPRTFRILEHLCFVFCSTYFVFLIFCFDISVEQNQTQHNTKQQHQTPHRHDASPAVEDLLPRLGAQSQRHAHHAWAPIHPRCP